jgi:gliding motility-associated-like protein
MWRRIIFLAILALLSAHAHGQITSAGGYFTIPDAKACAPYTGTKTIVVNDATILCGGSNQGDPTCGIDFDYRGPGSFTQDQTVPSDGKVVFNYTTPGTYSIFIKFGAGGPEDSVRFTVLPGEPPEFNVYLCSGSNAVQLDITDPDYDDYLIDYDNDNTYEVSANGGLVPPMSFATPGSKTINVKADFTGCQAASKTVQAGSFSSTGHAITMLDVLAQGQLDLQFTGTVNNDMLYSLERSTNGGAFAEIASAYNVAAYSDSDVNTNANVYCYRLALEDPCTSARFNSPVICSHTIDVSVQDGHNDISWNTDLTGGTALNLVKDVSNISAPFNNTGTYPDNAVTCGTEYCYRLQTTYPNNAQSLSERICATAVSNQPPPAINQVTTVVDGNSVRLEWLPDPLYSPDEYDIFRIPTHISAPLASTAELAFTDEAYEPFKGYCYQIRYDDVCDNRSNKSQEVCPIELKATLSSEDNSVMLEWNPYNGWSDLDHYTIEKYDALGQLIFTTDLNQTSYNDTANPPGQVFSYRILAFPVSATTPQPSISNSQTIIKSPRLYHPTAFVPASKIAENRTFAVRGIPEYIASYELRIFNRWGEMMFFSTDMNNAWDGTYKGVAMPEGTYIFKTRVIDFAGRTFDYTGAVILFRK